MNGFRVSAFRRETLARVLVLFSAAFFSVASFAAALAPSAVQQLQALKSIKAAKTSVQNKIGSRLYLGLLNQQKDSRLAALTSFRFVKPQDDGRVPIEVVLSSADGVKPVINKLESLGDVVIAKSYARKVVSARAHLGDLETLAGIANVRKVREAIPSRTEKINTSEGDATHGADETRGFYGVIGSGVKICVMSNGVDSLATIQASGDLPPSVDVLPGQAGSGDEGTAMLEIVHDLAPGATLGFAQAGPDEAGFAQNILDLATAGCNIIVDDVIYLDESPFEDGPVAQSVNTVTAAGVLYFSSAGNEGNLDDGTSGTWEGDFLASAAADPAPLNGANLHDFGDGGNSILVDFGGGNPPILIWAEHYTANTGNASTDFDLYDMDGALTTIFDASTDTQDGTGGDDFPVEIISGGTFSGERLLIDKFTSGSTSSTPMMNLIVFRGELDSNVATSGATRGHSAAVNAFSVAATPAAASFDGISPDGPFPGLFTAANKSEDFTSDGPRRIILDGLTGNELTPGNRTSTGGVVRQKPDFTAADGVSTATPGFNPFYGTSAAAPHAAAIAGLLKSGMPGLTQVQVRTALIASAIDIEAAGVDRDTGAGIIMAHAALASVGVVPQVLLQAGTAVPTQVAGDGDAFVEINEIWNLTIPLTNPSGANATAISATLTTTTPGITITSANSAYPDITSGSSGNNTTPFTFRVGAAALCGGNIDFTLTVTLTGGTSPQTFNFSIPTGEPGAPTTFSYTGPPVPIPDGADASGTAPGAAVSAPLVVTGVAGNVYAVTMSIDGTACSATAGSTTVGLDHTFVNDLQISLIAPDNTTALVINHTDGGGNNFCQTVLDDTASTSIQSVTTAQAPFTGTFASNSSALSTLRSKVANGTWKLQAQDFATGDTGNIRAYSINLTPAVCNAPALTSTVTGTKTVSGTFNPGQTVTYTVTLSNSGNFAQGDNAGHEFTDVLPPSLTLVNATGTSGTTVSTPGTNTVTWDGSIPAAGSVTITITATINAVANGTVVSNQGSISYDADANGVNESTATTDDPSVAGANDPTSFTVVVPPTPIVTGTKTVSGGDLTAGGTVIYSVVLTNSGNAAQTDNPGHEFTDTLPASLTLQTATTTSGTVAVAGNVVNWDGSIPGSGGTVTITITAGVNAGTGGQTISNQGTISYDGDGNGTNESTATTNGPGGGPTTFTALAPPAAVITATKTISGGNKTEGGNVVYTVTLTNTGPGAQADNPGNEFTDVLPPSLTLVSATASSGTPVATVGTNTVTWNGSIAPAASVTITITASVHSGTGGTTVSNQGTASYDSNADGTNDATVQTDDPAVGGAADPTSFVVARAVAVNVIPAPTLSLAAMILAGLLLAGIATLQLRKRSGVRSKR